MNPQQNPYPPVQGTPQYGGGQPPVPQMAPPRMPKPKKHFDYLIIPVVLLALILIGVLVWGIQTNGQKNDYKNNVDEKVDAAVVIAKKEAEAIKEKEYLEREKSPYRQYKTPSPLGSVGILYPKIWAGYVDEQKTINGFFHPDFVPGTNSGTGFALRLEVLTQTYDNVMQTYKGAIQKGEIKSAPYKLPKVQEVLGSKLDGQISKEFKGSMVILPLRDKTIKVYTMSESFIPDFNNIILPNMTFIP